MCLARPRACLEQLELLVERGRRGVLNSFVVSRDGQRRLVSLVRGISHAGIMFKLLRTSAENLCTR